MALQILRYLWHEIRLVDTQLCNRIVFVLLCFGIACAAIMFAVATSTAISCSLGRHRVPVLSLSFLDDYGHRSVEIFIGYDPESKNLGHC